MSKVIPWLWRELTRPRGQSRHRFYRGGRSSRGGMALLLAISSVMLLTVLVTEIVSGATVRIQLAAQHRDEVKAEALATTGVHLYRLILMLSKQVGNNPMVAQFGQMLGINADSIWQMVPTFNTQLLRMVLATDGDIDEEDAEAVKANGGLTEEQREASREDSGPMRRNFMDFDGDFSAEIQDENRRIYVGKFNGSTLTEVLATPAGAQIYAMLGREEYQVWLRENNIIREELIGNLVDWTDPDDVRIFQGGRESALYERLEPPYLPKNAPFDTREEIRLVEGWHLDGVWERVGHNLTIYGNGRVNVNTAHRPVLFGLLMAYADGVATDSYVEPFLEELMRLRGMPMSDGGVHFSSAQQFASFMQTLGLPLRPEIADAITTQSDIFRITSAGEVGDARVEVHAVMDFVDDPGGRIVYWRAR
jgi:general secretion pathway protein K